MIKYLKILNSIICVCILASISHAEEYDNYGFYYWTLQQFNQISLPVTKQNVYKEQFKGFRIPMRFDCNKPVSDVAMLLCDENYNFAEIDNLYYSLYSFVGSSTEFCTES